MTAEIWKPVAGYEGLYEVSDLGRVRSLDRLVVEKSGKRRPVKGRILRPGVSRSSGRRSVALRPRGPAPTRRVYELVLEAFVGPRPPGMVACHNNGDAGDDRLANLRWDSWSENHRDTVRHGRNAHANTTHCPRGHELVPANLQQAMFKRTGGRACLACHRATSNYRSAIRRGLPANFQALADEHYQRILTCVG